MSKAFTKEIECEADVEGDAPSLPAGVKNYITAEGFQRLQDEFSRLQRIERPAIVETVAWAASNGDRSENGDYICGKRRLREIDRRLRFLRKRMEIAEIVVPAKQKDQERVYFGATVRFLTENSEQKTVRIVGIDEARPEHQEISWVSPVAKALLKAREGDSVLVRTPAGSQRLEILKISY
ncbi:MAG TPA: transcription elongation factor GreB [Methylocella sp.]|nr:transcription elongation factor GreB [Methylocella sp.]